MQVVSQYYNYYNVKGRYSPETPQTPAWRKAYEVVEDRVESNNFNRESETYKAHVKLEELYYDAAVKNRARYKDVNSLKQALSQKYLFNDAYSHYDYTQRRAMYENELDMTMFGTCGNMSDPRLGGSVKGETDEEQAAYNRKMVNTQISNILSNAGLDISMLGDMTFSIEPYNYMLTVLGVDDEKARIIEQLLSSGSNSRELFYHILQSNRSRIDEDVMDKYRAMKDFREITGEDLRNYHQTADGFVDENGRNALEVYKEALKTSDSVPAQFKGAAFGLFSSKLQSLMGKNFASISDMNLHIGFSKGELQNSVFNPYVMKGLDITA